MRISSAVPDGTGVFLHTYPAVPAGLFSHAPGGAWIMFLLRLFSDAAKALALSGVLFEAIFRCG